MVNITGYKAFDEDRKNRYGNPFEEGKIYQVDGCPVFGVMGVGYHFCERLEDTLRFFDGMNKPIEIAKVTSLGDYVTRDDEYYGYYDMYCTKKIRIDRFLTRDEIIKMFLEHPERQNEFRVCRFLQGYRLTEREKQMFRLAYVSNDRIQKTISYYQDGDKDVYQADAFQKRLKGQQK